MKISMRSMSGPDNFRLYMATWEGEQIQGFSGLFKNPQGQGLAAPININRLGKVKVFLAREMVIFPSSIGWRKDSKTSRWNSGNSSKNKTPRCARVISPGRKGVPPPSKEASEAMGWGEGKGRWLTMVSFSFNN